MEIDGYELDRRGLARHVGQLSQVAGVRLVELADGPGRGVRVLEFRSGAGLAFEVVVDRAFDLGHAAIDGRTLSWTSPVGIEGPWYREATTPFGWLRGFGGGLMVTGGLDHALFPVSDDASHLRFPPLARQDYPLHGRVTGEPARLVGHGELWGGELGGGKLWGGERRNGDACTLWAEGEVRQAAHFGEAIELRRRIEVEVGTNRIRLRDRVTNHAHHTTPHMLLYHVNLGFPLVGEGARLHVDHEAAAPRGDFSMDAWRDCPAPTPDFTEEVVEVRPRARDGWSAATMVSPRGDLALRERFRAAELPYLFMWRMFGEGIYVVGVEPSTNAAAGREDARERGELVMLGPGESRDYALDLDAASGADGVAQLLEDG